MTTVILSQLHDLCAADRFRVETNVPLLDDEFDSLGDMRPGYKPGNLL